MKFSGFNTTEKVGIGVGITAPNANLNIGSASAFGSQSNPALQIGGTTYYRLGFYTTAEGAVIENKNGDDGIIFKVKTLGEAMRIDSPNGSVGIGTTSPAYNLHIKPASGNARLKLESDSNTADVEMMLDSASSTRNAHITFYNAGTQKGGVGYVSSDTIMKMWGSNNPADDHLCINSSGSVGIGTPSPSVGLEVAKTSADASFKVNRTDQTNIQLIAAGSSYVRASAALILQSNGANNRLTLAADGSSTFSGSLKATTILDSSNSAGTNGQVLTSTGSALDWKTLSEISGVDGSGTANYIPKWTDADTIGNSTISDNASTVTVASDFHVYKVGSDKKLWLSEGTSGSGLTNVQLSSNGVSYLKGGSVGIGTNAPGRNLHIKGALAANNTVAAKVENTGTGFAGLDLATDGTDWSILAWGSGTATPNQLSFYNGSTHPLAITSDGKIGIGCTPAAPLDTVGRGSFRYSATTSSSKRIDIEPGNTSNTIQYVTNPLNIWNSSSLTMSMLNDGKVGIGTGSPSRILTINDATLPCVQLCNGQTGTATGDGYQMQLSGVTGYLYNYDGQIIFGTSNAIALTLDTSQNATFNGLIKAGNLSISSQEIDVSSGDLILDVAGTIKLDSDNGTFYFQDGGTIFGIIEKSGTSMRFRSGEQDGDMIFMGNDGGTNITALTLDMSASGAATFNDQITLGGNLVHAGNFTLDVGGDITLDADGGDWKFQDAGTSILEIQNDGNGNAVIIPTIADKDIKFLGNDGGSTITALLLDMSDAGAAIFNSDVRVQNGAKLKVYRSGNSAYAGVFMDTGEKLYIRNSWANKDIVMLRTGEVGIGTDSPSATLDVVTPASSTVYAAEITQSNTSNGDGLYVNIGSTSANDYVATFRSSNNNLFDIKGNGQVGVNQPSPAGTFHIVAKSGTTGLMTVGAASNNIAHFYTSASATALVIDSGGKVGIGTTTPDSLGLNIARASTDPTASYTANSQLVIGLVGSTTHKLAISRDTDGDNAYIHSYQDGVGAKNLILQPGGGIVGIGTTAPGAKLHVYGSSAETTIAKIDGSLRMGVLNSYIKGPNDYKLLRFTNSGLVYNEDGAAALDFRMEGDTNINLFLLDASADSIGIGAAPISDASLYVAGSKTYPLRVQTTNAQYYFADSVIYANSANGMYIVNQSSHLALGANNAELMRLTGGSVGIGTTTPSTMLEVKGTNAEIRVHSTNENVNQSLISIGSDLHATNSKDSWIRFYSSQSSTDRTFAAGAIGGKFKFNYIATRATAPTGGTTVLTLDGVNDRVGIGTDAPASELQINGSHTSVNENAPYGTNSTHINLKNTSDTDGNLVGVLFEGAVSAAYMGGMYMEMENHSSFYSKLHFATRNDSSFGSKMVLAKDGNVGIGTTAPGSLLNLYSSAQRQFHWYAGTSPSGNNYVSTIGLGRAKGSSSMFEIKYDSEGSEHAYISRLYTNAVLHFDKAGTDHMTILADGKVGIGTNAPSYKLHVDGGALTVKQGTSAVQLGEYSNGAVIWLDGANGDFAGGDYFNIRANNSAQLTFGYAGGESVYISSAGNVGIGAGNPLYKLHVLANSTTIARFDGGTQNNWISINSDSGKSAGIVYEDADSPKWYVGHYNGNTDGFSFYDASTSAVKVFIKEGGSVGIGTTAPEAALHVVGGIHLNNASAISWDQAGGTLRNAIRVDSGDDLHIGDTNFDDIRFSTGQKTDCLIIKQTTGDINQAGGKYVLFDGAGATVGQIFTLGGNNLTICGTQLNHCGLSFATNAILPATTGATNNNTVDLGANGNAFKDFYIQGTAYVRNSDGNNILWGKGTRWGYSTSYRAIQIGDASGNYTVCIGYDPSGNSSGSFTGDGREMLFRNGLSFVTPNAADDGWHNTLTLKNGNVGIGDTTPDYKLDVGGTFRAVGAATFANVLVGQGSLLYLDGGSNTYIYSDTADSIALATNSGVRLTANNNGVIIAQNNILQLGTGASNSSGKIRFYGGSGTAYYMDYQPVGTNDRQFRFNGSSSGSAYTTYFNQQGTGGHDVYVDGHLKVNKAGGNTFSIYGQSSSTVFNVGATGGVAIAGASGNDILTISNSSSGAYINVASGAFKVQKDGNVGIGTDNPANKLQVKEASDITPTSGGAGQFAVQGNGYTTFLAMDGTAAYFGHNSSGRHLRLMTNETTRLAIDGGGTYIHSYTHFLPVSNGSYSSGLSSNRWSNTYSVLGNFSSEVTVGGNIGINGAAPSGSYALNVNGNGTVSGSFSASSKSFLIDHPTKENKKLEYGSLEGPEFGVYHRGRAQSSTITLPDYWTALVREETITVQLTPKGSFQHLYVVSQSLTEVVIGAADGETIDCYYTVYAERADIDRLEVEKEV
jgi:hypothetical protein